MSQITKCEFTHKRGAKIITHIVFIKPDLSRDRAFFISPTPSLYHKLSKESRFLTKKWRFGGGITPLDRCSSVYAPLKCGDFFWHPLHAKTNRSSDQILNRSNKKPDLCSHPGTNFIETELVVICQCTHIHTIGERRKKHSFQERSEQTDITK
jgi:hypothetical protein